MIVVGGGIGGLSAALALARQGLRVRVLERAREFGEVGAGIQIAPNCTRLLHEYGLLTEATTLGVLPDGMVMRDAARRQRADPTGPGRPAAPVRLPLHGHPPERPARHLPARLRPGRRGAAHQPDCDVLREHTRRRPGRPRGRRYPGRGRRHRRRRPALGRRGSSSSATTTVNSAYVAYRAALPIDQVLGNGIARTDVVVYVGPRCHFVQYPLRGGELLNQVAVFQSPRALRRRRRTAGTPDELDAAFEAPARPCAPASR